MKCPFCRLDNDRVIDSRSSQDGLAIRRRRECLSCSRRFTTYERPEETTIKVIKKDGSRVPFEREKIKGAVRKGQPVKILGQGDISVAVQVSVDAFSSSAKEKIEAAGGTTTVV